MKQQKKITFLLLGVFIALSGFAQDKEGFKPSGKVSGRIYANFNAGVTDAVSNETAFAIQRAYFGYAYQLTEEFKANVLLDVNYKDSGNENVSDHFVYVKNAFLNWTKDKWQINFGLIPLTHFKLHEKYWGHRYLYKSFQDVNKMGTTADLGVSAIFQASDDISFDFTMRNGEGYKKIQGDDNYLYGLGAIVNLPAGFIARVYGDLLKAEGVTQKTVTGFLGYKNDDLAAGAEYSFQENNKNVQGTDKEGWSAYASYNFDKKWQLFGRYDNLTSDDTETLIGGVQYSPAKKIKFALNYQGVSEEGIDIFDDNSEGFVYLNLEVKF